MSSPAFRAGAASRNVDPPFGLPMCGVVRRDWTGASRIGSLEVTALAFESGDSRVVLCGVDTIAVQSPEIDDLRARIAAATGAPLAGILVNASHTHHAPPGSRYFARGARCRAARAGPGCARVRGDAVRADLRDLPGGVRPPGAGLDPLGAGERRLRGQPPRARSGRHGPPARLARGGHARPVRPRAAGRPRGRDRDRHARRLRRAHRDHVDRERRVLARLPRQAPRCRAPLDRRGVRVLPGRRRQRDAAGRRSSAPAARCTRWGRASHSRRSTRWEDRSRRGHPSSTPRTGSGAATRCPRSAGGQLPRRRLRWPPPSAR